MSAEENEGGFWQRAVDPWWDALGVAGTILLGVVLLFFPEPATSVLGVIIIIAAALVWLGIDLRQEMRYTSRREVQEPDMGESIDE
jgi:drug/metabolite transporter (DMT)-like permease